MRTYVGLRVRQVSLAATICRRMRRTKGRPNSVMSGVIDRVDLLTQA